MKKITSHVLGALTITLACASVFAVDGAITINGAITDQTCILGAYLGTGTGIKDITIPLSPVSKSNFTPNNTTQGVKNVFLSLLNPSGAACDVAINKVFRGAHLSPISPDDLDATDKTLLVNKAVGAGGASAINPVFIRMFTEHGNAVDFSAPWGTQARGLVYGHDFHRYLAYRAGYVSKTGIVDAQNVTATINYTLHYN